MLKKVVSLGAVVAMVVMPLLGNAQAVQLGGVGQGVKLVAASLNSSTTATPNSALNSVPSATDQVRLIFTKPASSGLNNRCATDDTSAGLATSTISSYTTANPSVFTTSAAHGLLVGDKVVFSGTLPSNMSSQTIYTVAVKGSNTTFGVGIQAASGGSNMTVTKVTGSASSLLGGGYLALTKQVSATTANSYLTQATSALLSSSSVIVVADDATCGISDFVVIP